MEIRSHSSISILSDQRILLLVALELLRCLLANSQQSVMGLSVRNGFHLSTWPCCYWWLFLHKVLRPSLNVCLWWSEFRCECIQGSLQSLKTTFWGGLDHIWRIILIVRKQTCPGHQPTQLASSVTVLIGPTTNLYFFVLLLQSFWVSVPVTHKWPLEIHVEMHLYVRC